MPAAIAVGTDGTAYVADAAAHDIRRIRRGRVDTIAGANDPGPSADERTGGYADGPASRARFSQPDGIAVAKDGTLYVADAGNHCIRKIARGVVSTFAGSPGRAGSADGTASAASFEDIRGIAIDGDGNLYVADDGAGVRKIDPSGTVTTLAYAAPKHDVVAVAARGSQSHLILAYADGTSMHVVAGGTDSALAYEQDREPGNSGLAVGFADAIAIVNENTLIVCDVAANAVRLVRFPSPPFVTDAMTRGLAGGIREGSDLAGGLADGPASVALVATPLGVALTPDGSIVVADAGNRRIRRIRGVDLRESVLADLSNLAFAKAYNIAIVGNSYAFFNVLWPESIGGAIEAGLARDRRATGLSKRVAVNVFRIDDLDTRAESTLVNNVLGDGEADLVILLANYYEPLDRAGLHDVQSELAKHGTKLLVVFTPQGFAASPLEFWKANVAAKAYDYAALRLRSAREESFVESLGARSLLLLDAMQAAEAKPDRRNFFYGADHHLTVAGSEWVGAQVLDELERWKPWRATAGAESPTATRR